MKWGVRRTKEQLGRHTIPKGTKMYRATVNANESQDGTTYVTFIKVDRDLYRGSYANQLRTNAGKTSKDPLYEKEFELKEDLNVPSRSEVKQVIKDIQAKDKKNQMAIETGKAMLEHYLSVDPWASVDLIDDEKSRKRLRDATKAGDQEVFNKVYDKELQKAKKKFVDKYIENFGDQDIDQMMINVTRSFGTSKVNRDRVIKELKKRGYNAMVDEAGVGSNVNGREGVEPLIVFDRGSSLQETKTRKVNSVTQYRADQRYRQWKEVADRYQDKNNRSQNKNKYDW